MAPWSRPRAGQAEGALPCTASCLPKREQCTPSCRHWGVSQASFPTSIHSCCLQALQWKSGRWGFFLLCSAAEVFLLQRAAGLHGHSRCWSPCVHKDCASSWKILTPSLHLAQTPHSSLPALPHSPELGNGHRRQALHHAVQAGGTRPGSGQRLCLSSLARCLPGASIPSSLLAPELLG